MSALADRRAIALYLDMLASERGAAANTIAAYGRDLGQASEVLGGALAGADATALERLSATVAEMRDTVTRTPPRTAASEFATACSVSLCA